MAGSWATTRTTEIYKVFDWALQHYPSGTDSSRQAGSSSLAACFRFVGMPCGGGIRAGWSRPELIRGLC